MRNSRWFRQRYYPLYLEEIYKPLHVPLIFSGKANLIPSLQTPLLLANRIISSQSIHLIEEFLLKCSLSSEFKLASIYATQILNLPMSNIPPMKGRVFLTDLTQRTFFSDLTRLNKLFFTDITRIRKYTLKIEP